MLSIRSNIKRPEYNSINNLGRFILKSLFESRYDNDRIKYNGDDIIQLLNDVGSRLTNDASELKFNWGDALSSQASAKQAVHNMSIRGSAIKHHNK